MALISFKAKGLQRRFNCNLTFNPDVNIITGLNGSGKTTVLKVIWYMMSGNLERIFREVLFDHIELITFDFKLSVSVSANEMSYQISIDGLTTKEKKSLKATVEIPLYQSAEGFFDDIEIDGINHEIALLGHGSFFFPTFRRIEGGFSLTEGFDPMTRRRASGRSTPPLDEALQQLSRSLSVYEHKFVTSISVKDVSAMYALKHAEAYEIVNRAHIRMSNNIEKRIHKFKEKNETNATDVLNDIQKESNRVTELREEKFKSFTVLDDLIGKVFAHKGIKLDANTTVGSSQESIQASRLSAGEKQMLSFVAYNAFVQRAVIFIDEPELSLHADWQRTLLPILLSQGTENQFLIATHSPFIYSKYPDKEIHIGRKKRAK